MIFGQRRAGEGPTFVGLVFGERPGDELHRDQIDDGIERAFESDREHHDDRVRAEPLTHHLDGAVQGRADAIELVDEADARDLVALGLPPDGLGLGLDAGDRIEHRDRTVEHSQRSLDLDGEVDVAGRVDQVDPMRAGLGAVGLRIAWLPEAGGRDRVDRDAAALLFLVEVGVRRTVVDLADVVRAARVEQDALGRRGLARIDVRHDPDVAGHADLTSVGWFGCRCGGHGEKRERDESDLGDEVLDGGGGSTDMRLGPRGAAIRLQVERVWQAPGPGMAEPRHPMRCGSNVAMKARWLDGEGLPAIVSESLVGVGHLVHVFALLDGQTAVLSGVEHLVGEALTHVFSGRLRANPMIQRYASAWLRSLRTSIGTW